MNTDPALIRAFVEVARTANFGQAAQALHVDPSTVSRQVSQLERRLGLRLFDRTTRQVWLTDVGRTLLADAEAAIAALDGFTQSARAADRQHRGEVVVGFQAHAINTEILGWIHDAETESGLTVALHEGNFTDPSTGLRDRSSDLAFVFTPFDTSGLELEPLFELPWLAFLPASHRLANRDSIELRELFGEQWIRAASDDRTFTDYWLAADLRELGPDSDYLPYATAEASLALIATGRAIGVGATVRGPLHLEGVVAIPVSDERRTTVSIGWTQGGLTPAAAAFRDTLLDHARRGVPNLGFG